MRGNEGDVVSPAKSGRLKRGSLSSHCHEWWKTTDSGTLMISGGAFSHNFMREWQAWGAFLSLWHTIERCSHGETDSGLIIHEARSLSVDLHYVITMKALVTTDSGTLRRDNLSVTVLSERLVRLVQLDTFTDSGRLKPLSLHSPVMHSRIWSKFCCQKLDIFANHDLDVPWCKVILWTRLKYITTINMLARSPSSSPNASVMLQVVFYMSQGQLLYLN